MKGNVAKVLSGPIGYLVVGGVVLLAIYYLVKKAGQLGKAAYEKGQELTKPLSDHIADAIIAVSLPPGMKVLGTVQLPDGRYISIDEISRVSGIDETGSFVYEGTRYTLFERTPQGYYTVL